MQAQEAKFGIPFSNNATGVQTHEMVIEANYDIHVFRGVNFQPEFQYVFRAERAGDDSLIEQHASGFPR